MSLDRRVKNSKENKLMEFSTEHKIYCTNPKCSGHGVVFMNNKIDYKLCPNCNKWIFRDEKAKLKYRMKERGIIKW